MSDSRHSHASWAPAANPMHAKDAGKAEGLIAEARPHSTPRRKIDQRLRCSNGRWRAAPMANPSARPHGRSGRASVMVCQSIGTHAALAGEVGYSSVGGARLRCSRSWSWSCNLLYFKLKALESNQVNSGQPAANCARVCNLFS